jgi:hypothetical protein
VQAFGENKSLTWRRNLLRSSGFHPERTPSAGTKRHFLFTRIVIAELAARACGCAGRQAMLDWNVERCRRVLAARTTPPALRAFIEAVMTLPPPDLALVLSAFMLLRMPLPARRSRRPRHRRKRIRKPLPLPGPTTRSSRKRG